MAILLTVLGLLGAVFLGLVLLGTVLSVATAAPGLTVALLIVLVIRGIVRRTRTTHSFTPWRNR